MSATLDQAYAHVESVTRDQARNFYYGIRLLSGSKRSALCAVYALARRIDDIGDGDLSQAAKAIQLAALRQQLRSLPDPASTSDPILRAVADVGRHFPISLAAFGELIDGVEMDITGRTYDTFDDLVGYCRCVAGSIGRLCLGVFGSDGDQRAEGYADALGIALQQTNILRDVREDLLSGRVYLPAEDLDRFGVTLRLQDAGGCLVDRDGTLTALVRFAANRAQTWYAEGLKLVPLLDRRSAACCTAMSGIYQRLLTQIADDPSRIFGQRLSLSGRDKAWVAARALAGRPI
ncbi:MAG: 15-cis-phytoene synthase [Pseudonocardiales bacterium]|jgi:phytoene synthase|nr:15-cis-phytoene synthase [Pseudonocardiales bacterium]